VTSNEELDPRRTSRAERLIIAGFVALVVGSGVAAYFLLLGPGEDASERALAGYVAAVRAGTASAPEHQAESTAMALRALAASTSYSVERSTGAFTLEGSGRVCILLTAEGPAGNADIVLALVGKEPQIVVTHLGLAPPCVCQRIGQVAHCGM
jgi:hypothetical protein